LIFQETKLAGAYVIEPERLDDQRGFFARTFCTDEFADQGLVTEFPQCSISYNAIRGTLRGMHFQRPPSAEAKLVRCTMGAVQDVIVDLRQDSSTCGQWISVELSAESRNSIYIPPGFAHGFLTLRDASEMYYQISERYDPTTAGGVRFDDPALNLKWVDAIRVIADRDRAYPDLES